MKAKSSSYIYDKSLPKHDSTLQHTVFPHIVSAETIQGRKLFKGGTYMRKYGILILFGPTPFVQALSCCLMNQAKKIITVVKAEQIRNYFHSKRSKVFILSENYFSFCEFTQL